MLNLVKQEYPKAELDYDPHGNPIMILNEKIGGMWDTEENQPFYVNKPGASLRDIDYAKAIGDRLVLPAAASVVAGPAGWLVGMGLVGSAGAVNEAMSQAETELKGAGEGFDISDMLMAGLFTAGGEGTGRLLAPAIGGLINVGRRILGKPKATPNMFIDPKTGELDAKFATYLKEQGISVDDLSSMVRRELNKQVADSLTPDEALTTAKFRSIKSEPTKGQASRDFAQMQFEQEMAKNSATGAPLRQRFSEQNKALLNSVDEVVGKMGGNVDEAFQAGSSAGKALRTKNKALDRAVSRKYRAVAKEIGEDGEIAFPNLVTTLENSMDYIGVSPAIGVLRKRMVSYGIIKSETDDIINIGRLTVKRAELLRREINQLADGADKTTKLKLGYFRDALDKDVLEYAGKDSFSAARKMASKRFAEFENKDTAGIVKKIVDSSIADDDVFQKVVVNGKLRDLQKVKQSLTTGSKSAVKRGTQAWNDLRAATVRNAYNEATRTAARNEAGDAVFSGPNFNAALRKVGGLKSKTAPLNSSPKLRELFTKDEIARLSEIAEVGMLRIPVPGSVNYSNTTSAMLNAMGRFESIVNYMPGGRIFTGLIRVGKEAEQAGKQAIQVKSALSVKSGENAAAKIIAKSKSPVPKTGTVLGGYQARTDQR
jgi:hypothetical protein